MTKKQIIIATSLGFISIGLAWAYIEFKKLTDYCLSVKKIKLKHFNFDAADIDLYMNFTNKSKLNFTILSQQYLIYINNGFVSKVSNAVPQNIKANSVSTLPVKIQFSPKQVFNVLKINALTLASSPETVKVKIATTMKIGYGILKFNINYDYDTNLKEMLTSDDPSSSAKKC